MNPPAQEVVGTSAPDGVMQEQAGGKNPMMSDLPSLRNTDSPPPPPQIPSQKEDGRSDPISPEGRGGRAGADESQDARSDASSKEMLQHPLADVSDNRSGSDPVSPVNHDGSAGIDKNRGGGSHASSKTLLQDPPSGAGCDRSGSCTNLQDALGDGDASRRDVSRMSTRDPLKELRGLDKSSPEFHDQISDILHGEEYKQCVSDLQGDDLVWLVDYLDQVRLPISLVRFPLKPP